MFVALVFDDARLRIAELAAARQLQLQERADVFQVDAAAADDLAALAHRKHCRAIDVVPELDVFGMRSAPFGFERLNFRVGEFVRLEFAPGIQAAHVAECEIAGLANTALRGVLCVGAGRHAEDPACGLAVRLVARITRRVIPAIAVEFPNFTSNPRQDAAFDLR